MLKKEVRGIMVAVGALARRGLNSLLKPTQVLCKHDAGRKRKGAFLSSMANYIHSFKKFTGAPAGSVA